MADHTYILSISCPDRVGLVAAVSGFLAEHQGWISEAQHHSDPVSGMFFMRQEIIADSLPFGIKVFQERFAPIADEYQLSWKIVDSAVRKRVVVLVSQQGHCLSDILHRWESGEYKIEIPCVISNHKKLRDKVEWYNVPYHHVAMGGSDKSVAFDRISQLCRDAAADVIVLARFMQILPPTMCDEFAGSIINIHHSFLPSFVGAKPYHQAFSRGVKLTGATCHYVTADLDAGPIIEQEVARVRHSHSTAELVRRGRDVETITLARGLRYHLEDRVLVHGNKTVVFD
ncbi:MAG: formyltetrahydrofolate deformylase [Rhodothermales bacterium]|jgi:formyltetrahydrofolate deformylase